MKVLGKLFSKQMIITSVLVLSIVAITMFSSYAFYFKIDPSEIAKSVNTDNLRITFSNNGYDQQVNYQEISTLNSKIKPNILSIFNHSEYTVRYKVYLKNSTIEENYLTDDIDYNNLLSRTYIQYQINDEEVKLLDIDESIPIYTSSVAGKNNIAEELKIKVWVDENIPLKELDKDIHLKFVVEELKRNIYGEEDSLVNTIINKFGGISNIEKKTPSIFSLSAIENEGLLMTKDDAGNSFYFRGSVLDNNVQFGTTKEEKPLLWKILRINGDKSVRLVLNDEFLESDELLKTTYNFVDSSNAFVGYCYGTVTAADYLKVHDNLNYSTAKINLEKWYEKLFVNTIYQNYIANSTFCVDRSLVTGSGLGKGITYYGSYQRIDAEIKEFTPTLTCSQDKDKFSEENSLIYPIGLLTSDELVFAGATSSVKNSLFYLSSKYNYWLMTPASYNRAANIYVMNSKSGLVKEKVSNVNYLRPVINIKGDIVVLDGDGTIASPYILDFKEKMVGN